MAASSVFDRHPSVHSSGYVCWAPGQPAHGSSPLPASHPRLSLSLFSLSFLSLSLSLSRSHRFFPSFVVSLGLQTSQYSSWVAFVDSPTSSRLEVLLPPTVRPVISPLSGLFSAISALPCVCLFLYLLGLHDNVWHHLRSDLFPHPISHRGTLGSSPALPPPSSAPPSPEETLPVLPAG